MPTTRPRKAPQKAPRPAAAPRSTSTPPRQPRAKPAAYSPEVFCNQLHALYDRLEKRRQAILADPALTPDNDALQQELEDVIRRIGLVRECFEEFCPS